TPSAAVPRHGGGPVGGPLAPDEDVGVAAAAMQVLEPRRQVLLLVPGRDEDDRVAHRFSSRRAARSWRGTAGAAPSSHARARNVRRAATVRNSVATPAPPYSREKKKRTR